MQVSVSCIFPIPAPVVSGFVGLPLMSSSPLIVRKVAVLGAGVMGAQIAAHLANANIPSLLFDLPAKEGDPNGLVTKAIAGLAKLEPAPLAPRTAPTRSRPRTTAAISRGSRNATS